MATIIVGHELLDLDCAVSMLGLAKALREVVGFEGQIKFTFVPQGATHRGVAVDPRHQCEWLDRDRIYHVDCGGGLLDHHRPGCGAPSSAVLIDREFGLTKAFPEWKRLVKWATEADQCRLRCGCALHAIIRGENRRLGPGHELTVLRFARRAVDALLTNEKIKVQAGQTPIESVEVFQPPEPGDDNFSLQVRSVDGFGNAGLIVGLEELSGSFRNRLEREAECRLLISFVTDKGKTAIMSCYPENAEPVDLVELGIVQGILCEEAQLRGIEPPDLDAMVDGRIANWFVFKVDGRIASFFNGSAKWDLAPWERTVIAPARIIDITLAELMGHMA